LPDALGIGLPTLALLLYIGFVVFNYMRRKRAGLRTQPLPRLLLQIVTVAVIVEGAVALFESYLGVPQSVIFLTGLILLCWLLLTKTPFGRYVYAVGGNAEAARRAGINVPLIRVAVFTMCSTLAAIGGVLAASRGLAVASQIDPTLLLDSIAAAVIGGVSLFGGKGSVWTLILGALIIGSLENGLDLKSQGTDVKEMVEGVVLVIAVAADALIRRAQARRGR
jgi:D-xylose transport system permease protein